MGFLRNAVTDSVLDVCRQIPEQSDGKHRGLDIVDHRSTALHINVLPRLLCHTSRERHPNHVIAQTTDRKDGKDLMSSLFIQMP